MQKKVPYKKYYTTSFLVQSTEGSCEHERGTRFEFTAGKCADSAVWPPGAFQSPGVCMYM